MLKEEFYYLNDSEKALIEGFVANRPMLEAVKKVLLSGVYIDGVMKSGEEVDPLKNFILGRMTRTLIANAPFEMKGQEISAIIHGISLFESGIKELEKFKKVEKQVIEKKNKSR